MATKLSQAEYNKRKQMIEQDQGWCSKCKQFKPLIEFSNSKAHEFGYSSWCKGCHSKSRKGKKYVQRKMRDRARTLQKYYTDLAGGSCQKCGYNRSWFALDFHHINPKEKRLLVSQAIAHLNNGQDDDEIIAEINKCVLLCSNCHREYEAGLWSAQFEKRQEIGWTIKSGTITENKLNTDYDALLYRYRHQQLNFMSSRQYE